MAEFGFVTEEQRDATGGPAATGDLVSAAVRQRAEQWIARGHDPALVELVGLLRHAADSASSGAKAVLAQHDLSRGQFDVLAALYRAGDDAALTQAELADAMLLTGAGMKKRVDALVTAGYIRRAADPHDQRKQRLLLTDAGRHVLTGLLDAFFGAEARAFAALGDGERVMLRDLLRRMLDRPATV